MSYTKLFSSIVTSTIWTEDANVCKVWVTLLAIADKHGEVHASIPGLAQIAGMPLAVVEQAIAKFLLPDKYSRTPDDEGRRIEVIDGGWFILNHAKYRAMASKDEEKLASAKRQAAFRERQKRNGKVTESNGLVTPSNDCVTPNRDIAEAEAEAEAEEREREERSLAQVEPKGRRFPDHQATIQKINALRPEWAKPAQWTGSELHSLHDALGQLEELTEDDWKGLKRYFAARLEKGAGFWQPKSRGQFVASLADVYANYSRWMEKAGFKKISTNPLPPGYK